MKNLRLLLILSTALVLAGCGNPVVFYAEPTPDSPSEKRTTEVDPAPVPLEIENEDPVVDPSPSPSTSPSVSPSPSPSPSVTVSPSPSPSVSPSPSSTPCLTVHCKADTYLQPDVIQYNSVDILFVTDTSGSLDSERPALAKSVQAFIAQLPRGSDYNVGVMLGHSSLSKWAGRLYAKNGNPKVLKSSEMTSDQIVQKLGENFTRLPTDSAADGGEEVLYSLDRGLDADRLQESQALGFFRPRAALAVILITDENDICTLFTQVPDPDKKEIPAYDRDCASNGVRILTEERVLKKIRNQMGHRPFLVGGVIYTNEKTVPRGGENSIGYGVKELVELSHGVLIDLADRDFTGGLAELGRLTAQQLALRTKFRIGFNHGSRVIARSIQVRVDGHIVPHHYNPSNGVVSIRIQDAGEARSKVRIRYCHLHHRKHHHGHHSHDGQNHDNKQEF